MTTTQIFNYDLEVDQSVKIQAEQQSSIARDYLRQFFKQLTLSGVVKKEEVNKQNSSMLLSESEHIMEAYKDTSLKDQVPSGVEYNSSVLASNSSKLVGMIMDKVEFNLYTIDSDSMIRVWDCSTNTCVRSYLIETREDQIREANQNEMESNSEKKKIQLVRSDADIKFLLVAFEAGEIQVNNLFTGALIYNNSNVKPIKIENEITNMKFFNSQTKFWIAASCWEGRVAFISRPQISQGRDFLMFKKCRCSHMRDVISLDINSENQLVTGSVDNILCFWNSFNGVESKKIVLPEEVANLHRGESIQYIRFPFKNKKEVLLIIVNNGNCFILEIQSEKFFEFNGVPLPT